MPKIVKEITSGAQFSRSSEQGQITDSQTRTFRAVLENPNETLNIQQACQIGIGDPHPFNAGIYCKSFSASFEGESRMSILCTFQYGPNEDTGNNPQPQPPDIRLAEWTMSSSLVESPAWVWIPEDGPDAGRPVAPANVVGDMYDGVTKLEPVVTISITQFETTDPTARLLDIGKINEDGLNIGPFLYCEPRTVMFRSLSKKPVVEAFGELTYVGFSSTYEFLYKKNFVGGDFNQSVGWDILVPQSGRNVIAFDPGRQAANDPNADPFGQPLKWKDGSMGTRVDGPPYQLCVGVNAGDKVQAMTVVPAHGDGGLSQNVASLPIPLNDDGTPRKHTANPKVLLKRYRLYEETSFSSFGFRL